MISDVLLERYLSGDLSAETCARIEAALRVDSAVKARYDGLVAERQAFFAADPPAAFAHRVATIIDVREEKKPRWRWLFSPAFAALAAIVLVVGVLFLNRDLSTTASKMAPETPAEVAIQVTPPAVAEPAPEPTPVPRVETRDTPVANRFEKKIEQERREIKGSAFDREDDGAAPQTDRQGMERSKAKADVADDRFASPPKDMAAPVQKPAAPRAGSGAAIGSLDKAARAEGEVEGSSESRTPAPAAAPRTSLEQPQKAQRPEVPRALLMANERAIALTRGTPVVTLPDGVHLELRVPEAYAVLAVDVTGAVRIIRSVRVAAGDVVLDLEKPVRPTTFIVLFGQSGFTLPALKSPEARQAAFLASTGFSGTELRVRVIPE